MIHEITYLSTRAKNLPPTRGRGAWRHVPASHCPKCSCGWIGMWTSDGPSIAQAVDKHLGKLT